MGIHFMGTLRTAFRSAIIPVRNVMGVDFQATSQLCVIERYFNNMQSKCTIMMTKTRWDRGTENDSGRGTKTENKQQLKWKSVLLRSSAGDRRYGYEICMQFEAFSVEKKKHFLCVQQQQKQKEWLINPKWNGKKVETKTISLKIKAQNSFA